MIQNPKLYEINTRVWIKKFGAQTTLSNIPKSFFEDLSDKGINLIWFMGVWKTCETTIAQNCFTPDLVSSYNKALKNWKNDDVIGSPFAIDYYDVNPLLGRWSDLKKLKKQLNHLGMKLILDFVPNHFSANSKIIKTNPDIFLQADNECIINDPFTYYKTSLDGGHIFAHGRDPLFPAWTDTIQVNYFSESARNFMTGILLRLAEVCDGVRCDMAMLPLNNVFNNTWLGILNKYHYNKPKEEFWELAINKVKEKYPEFIFIGEAYWDLEWNLQQIGFDFTYDKRLTDRLAANDISGAKAHLTADKSFQLKSVRFLENHDEPRAVTKFGEQKSLAAAVFISTVMGMKFYYDGQFEGSKIKLPVQLGRMPDEKKYKTLKNFYDRLLYITKVDIFKFGNWMMLNPLPAAPNNHSFESFFAWQWTFNNEYRIVVINYSDKTSQCRLKFQLNTDNEFVVLNDLLNNKKYKRSSTEIKNEGLFIELKNYHSHIFSINH